MAELDGSENPQSENVTENGVDLVDMSTLGPEVMQKQAIINIGTIGHVAHGKSTVVKALSGVQTVRFKTELERNITIKLGYANAKVFKCSHCPSPQCYSCAGSSHKNSFKCKVKDCEGMCTLVRHFSFVDCPGHDVLMATMLNGAAVMDGALLLIAGNEPCPQPQTSEHLAAIEIMKLAHIIILQNKIDLIAQTKAVSQHQEILEFIKGTVAESSPIIPISAQLKYNIDYLCEYLVKHVPVPKRDLTSTPRLIIVRSFDVNKPGTNIFEIKGGVIGGCLLRGVLKERDRIEIRPGILSKDENGNFKCEPLFTYVVSLHAENNKLDMAYPGGLIGVGTTFDPAMCRGDNLVGQVLGIAGCLPDIYCEVDIVFALLRRLLGVRVEGDKKPARVQKLAKGDMLMVNIGTLSTGGRVNAVKGDMAKIMLNNPVCTEVNEKMALSRKIKGQWRLIGWGTICGGVKIEPTLTFAEHSEIDFSHYIRS